MRITRANVEAYALKNGWEAIQIDGIPEGFAWKMPDVEIGEVLHKGKIIKFKPLGEWDIDITYE